jgi:hypothetical protein
MVSAKDVPEERARAFAQRRGNVLTHGSDLDEARAWFPEFPDKVIRERLKKVCRRVYGIPRRLKPVDGHWALRDAH